MTIKKVFIHILFIYLPIIGIFIYSTQMEVSFGFNNPFKLIQKDVSNTFRIESESSRPISWKPTFTRGQIPTFYLYGASIRNTSKPSIPDEIAIYGQWSKNQSLLYFTDRTTHCCLIYHQHTVMTSPITRRRRRTTVVLAKEQLRKDYKFAAFYFVCPITGNISNLPVKASVAFGEYNCSDEQLPYIPTFLPEKSNTLKIGMTNKVAHGSLNSKVLIEWFEAIIHIGVDKVLTYADVTLNNDARKVLNHYEHLGFCEVIPLELPALDTYNRSFTQRGEQAWHDYQVIQWDSLERLRGYTYYGQLDTDEFLVPSGNRSLKQLLTDLDVQHNVGQRRYAGYYFMTAWFNLDLKENTAATDLEINRYIHRYKGPVMEPAFKKSYILPEFVDFYMGSEIAYTTPNTTLKFLDVPSADGYVRHYKHGGLRNKNNVKDTEMRDWTEANIAAKVNKVKELIFKK